MNALDENISSLSGSCQHFVLQIQRIGLSLVFDRERCTVFPIGNQATLSRHEYYLSRNLIRWMPDLLNWLEPKPAASI